MENYVQIRIRWVKMRYDIVDIDEISDEIASQLTKFRLLESERTILIHPAILPRHRATKPF